MYSSIEIDLLNRVGNYNSTSSSMRYSNDKMSINYGISCGYKVPNVEFIVIKINEPLRFEVFIRLDSPLYAFLSDILDDIESHEIKESQYQTILKIIEPVLSEYLCSSGNEQKFFNILEEKLNSFEEKGKKEFQNKIENSLGLKKGYGYA